MVMDSLATYREAFCEVADETMHRELTFILTKRLRGDGHKQPTTKGQVEERKTQERGTPGASINSNAAFKTPGEPAFRASLPSAHSTEQPQVGNNNSMD